VEPAIRVVGETVGGQPRAGFGVPVAVGCRRAEVAGGWSAGGVDAEVLLARDIGLALVDDTLLKTTVIKIALITTRTRLTTGCGSSQKWRGSGHTHTRANQHTQWVLRVLCLVLLRK
jgi:hypothetical protein